jgi:hypothetical protein
MLFPIYFPLFGIGMLCAGGVLSPSVNLNGKGGLVAVRGSNQ